MTAVYPLQWPDGRKRTSLGLRAKAAFSTTFAAARDNLVAEVRRLGGGNIVIAANAQEHPHTGSTFGNSSFCISLDPLKRSCYVGHFLLNRLLVLRANEGGPSCGDTAAPTVEIFSGGNDVIVRLSNQNQGQNELSGRKLKHWNSVEGSPHRGKMSTIVPILKVFTRVLVIPYVDVDIGRGRHGFVTHLLNKVDFLPQEPLIDFNLKFPLPVELPFHHVRRREYRCNGANTLHPSRNR
jgi:hypothetical protein